MGPSGPHLLCGQLQCQLSILRRHGIKGLRAGKPTCVVAVQSFPIVTQGMWCFGKTRLSHRWSFWPVWFQWLFHQELRTHLRHQGKMSAWLVRSVQGKAKCVFYWKWTPPHSGLCWLKGLPAQLRTREAPCKVPNPCYERLRVPTLDACVIHQTTRYGRSLEFPMIPFNQLKDTRFTGSRQAIRVPFGHHQRMKT